MKREIKFRAWDKETKKMFENETLCSEFSNWYVWIMDGQVGRDIELMQFTGLKDKNGKEIYEGDIVKFYYLGWHTSEVVYMSDGFYVKTNGHIEDVRENLGLAFPFKDIEIIGNIYENPDLIKQ